MTTLELQPLPPGQPTSYVAGGRTRDRGGAIPPITSVLTVGRIGGLAWRLAPKALEDFTKLQSRLVELGAEPFRLTDAWRDGQVQARSRAAYLAWVKAGRPDPLSPGWVSGMKTAYVAPAGESNHGWGGAIDIDVGALYIPGHKRGSNGALAAFWEVAIHLGWEPIISKPSVNQSEAWHFDHLGPLADVHHLYDVAGSDYAGKGYGQTARVGCALMGTLPRESVADTSVAEIQARCAIAGSFPGLIDGIMGPKTIAACRDGLDVKATKRMKPNTILVAMREAEIGHDRMARL